MRQVRPVEAQIVHDIVDGHVVIIRSDTGSYYSLEGTAAEVWVGILSGLDEPGIVAEMEARYPDAAPRVPGDVAALVDRLIEESLVEPGRIAEPEPNAGPVPSSPAWTTPNVEAFTDMQDLLLFDPIHEVGPEGWPHAADDRG